MRLQTSCVVTAVFVLCLLMLSSVVRAEDERPWRLEIRPGYVWQKRGEDLHGVSAGLMGGWRAFDTVVVKLDAEVSSLGVRQPGESLFTEIAGGFNYDIDLAPLFPTIGAGLGPLFRKYEGESWTTSLSWHVLGAAVYQITPLLGLGVEIKYHLILTEFSQDPFFMTVAAKAALSF